MIYVRVRDGMDNATEAEVRGFVSDIMADGGGVIDMDHFEVEPDSGLNLSVTPGIVYVPNSSFDTISRNVKYYEVRSDSEEAVQISTNTSGLTRVDLVCVKVNKAIAPDDDASNVASIEVVEGIPGSGAPSLPVNHYKLAQVTVADSAVTLTSGNISDTREAITISNNIIPAELSLLSLSSSYIFVGQIIAGTVDVGYAAETGWIDMSHVTWTSPGGNVFKVSGDVTAIYRKGVKYRCKQGAGWLYGVIASSSFGSGETTVTVLVNVGYLFVTPAPDVYSTITDNQISLIENPEGFPPEFTYSPTFLGSSSNPVLGNGSINARYSVNGTTIDLKVKIVIGSTTTNGSGTYSLTLPTNSLGGDVTGSGLYYDASVPRTHVLTSFIDAVGTGLRAWVDNVLNLTHTSPATPATGDEIHLHIIYRF